MARFIVAQTLSGGTNIQADQDLFGIGKVADDFPQGHGNLADESGDCEYLMILGEGWIFQQVDYFDLVASSQMLGADFLEVGDGGNRPGSLAGDVQPQEHRVL